MNKFGASQKAIIYDGNKFLVLLRGKTAPSNPHKWDLPGGDIDFGEDAYQSISREIKEETGLKIDRPELFDVHSFINKRGEHWLTLGYKAKYNGAEVQISWEHEAFLWVTKKEYFKLPNIPRINGFVEKFEP
jgi:8-oxo-dGTP diphosphatase